MELKVLVCLSYHPNILKSSWPQKDLRLWHKSQTTISSKCFLIFSGINIWIIKKNNQDWFNFKNIFLKRFYSRLIIQSLLDITRAITRSSVNYRELSFREPKRAYINSTSWEKSSTYWVVRVFELKSEWSRLYIKRPTIIN